MCRLGECALHNSQETVQRPRRLAPQAPVGERAFVLSACLSRKQCQCPTKLQTPAESFS